MGVACAPTGAPRCLGSVLLHLLGPSGPDRRGWGWAGVCDQSPLRPQRLVCRLLAWEAREGQRGAFCWSLPLVGILAVDSGFLGRG